MADTWHLLARVHGADAAEAVLPLLEAVSEAVTAFEIEPGPEWRVEAYPGRAVLTPELTARLALAAVAAGGALLEISEQKLAERDWLADNRLAFPPMRVGRFFIHGSHYRGRMPAGAIAIRVDAATAFGTGEHASTRGCLLALERIGRMKHIRHPLDIGTGTGVLAIAAARLTGRPVVARDIDGAAIAVARRNIGANSVRRLVRAAAAPGYRGLPRAAYDVVLSNILARPLAGLARDLSRVLQPGGRAVLSGLLARQEALVIAAHRLGGLAVERRVAIEGWSTLVMRRRPARRRLPLASSAAAGGCRIAR
jgi:ribosomal protein L11 methyltransferase